MDVNYLYSLIQHLQQDLKNQEHDRSRLIRKLTDEIEALQSRLAEVESRLSDLEADL